MFSIRLLQKSFLSIVCCFIFLLVFIYGSTQVLAVSFPLATDQQKIIGLKTSASFDLNKNQTHLKILAKTKLSDLSAIRLSVDSREAIYINPAKASSTWLDLPSGEHELLVSATDASGSLAEATTSTYVPYLEAPFIDKYNLRIRTGEKMIIGGSTIYPAKQVVIHLGNLRDEKTFLVDIDNSGRFVWQGEFERPGSYFVWAEVIDSNLRSLSSNKINFEVIGLIPAIRLPWSPWALNPVIALIMPSLILFIALILSIAVYFSKYDKKISIEKPEEKLKQTAALLKEEVLSHVDLLSATEGLSKEVELSLLTGLNKTVMVVGQYLENRIKILTKKKSAPVRKRTIKTKSKLD